MEENTDELTLSAVWNQLDRPPSGATSNRAKIQQKNSKPRVPEYPEEESFGNRIAGINAQKRRSAHDSGRPRYHATEVSSRGNSRNINASHGSRHSGFHMPERSVRGNSQTRYDSNGGRRSVSQETRNFGSASHSGQKRGQDKAQNNRFERNRHFEDGTSNSSARETAEYEPRPTYDAKPISFATLRDLITKSPDEILISINKKRCGFSVFLSNGDTRPDMMALALIALGKSCSANLKKNVSALIQNVCNNTEFLLTSVQRYLVSFRLNTVKTFHLESLCYLTSFLQKFQNTMPSSSSEIVSILLPLLKLTCEKFLSSHELYDEVIKELNEIQEQNEEFIKEHSHFEIKKVSFQEKQHLLEPPENYRLIPILPNADDINSPNTFLRGNVVKGKYSSTEHYLDVQYRLLREDYVRPLREGIAEYLRLKKSGKSTKNCRDVRVYNNVHIVKQDFVNGGIVHIASFHKENFSKIKWEYSKRFLTGSLLCFSSDDFQTMLFASVARRVPEELKKGLLLIRFEDISDEVLNLNSLKSFVVIETTAYFEAYRYNLRAIHELNEDNLPLKKYIIDVERTVDPPHYLHDALTYDFRPLFLPLEEKYIKHAFAIDGDMSVQYDFSSCVPDRAKCISILNDASWPSELDLNLDHSQYIALKAATTREFAVIQGPPGTGKTYIGLRIVQLLLHNLHKWHLSDINSLPILVVCFTNHALDQFLEGLMLFTNKIVRIGGRGTNEAVSNFQLSTLKRNAVAKKEIPKYITSGMWHKNVELRSLKQDIDKINQSIEKCNSIVLGENVLNEYIPSFQNVSLKSVTYSSIFREQNLKDDGLIIHDWLCIRNRMDDWNDNLQVSEIKNKETAPKIENNIPAVENDDDDIDSIGEADIEFIEAQRDIDAEDFMGVSFDIEVPETEELQVSDAPGWQVQGGKKKLLKYIKNNLRNSTPFDEATAMSIRDVWRVNVPQRWKLYKFWLEKYINEKEKECMNQQQLLKTQYQEVCEMRTEEDIFVLKKAHIVGMTTTGAAKYRDIVLRLNPQILIVEEAAEILESHIVTSLAPKTQHVILIGDHQQLRPSPTVHALAVHYGLNISLFERMIKNNMECFRLSIQHRMRPDVADLIVPHIYTDLKNHEVVTKFEDIKGVSKNVFFINHSYNEDQEADSKSKVNEHEAKFIIKLCKYLILQGYDSSKITVLTTYSGQLFVMKKLVDDVIRKVRFTVVDNFQGEENDIILISFVRSNEEGEIGFLKVANRVCVALSRAKKGLYCIGNFELLAEKSDLWKNIVGTLQQKQGIGPSLQLMCQNHPGVCSVVANEKDFESVPEGGCSRLCEYRLACGHVCSLMCHPYDMAHEKIRCHKECNKMCEQGHKCEKKCFKECGPCKHLVDKKMYLCGHTIQVYCHMQDQEVKCFADCEKVLPCGHKCTNICNEACVMICKNLVKVKSPICGHEFTIECCFHNRPEKLMEGCTNPCSAVLECGHSCQGSCTHCHQGRLHVACNQPCKRILVCGHECKSPCSKSCPPCKHPCENRCVHSKCPKKCGEPCEQCIETCEWICAHKKCTRLCGDVCNRTPCNKPCDKWLPCKHPCIGFCGEPCPEECRECNSDIVKDIFFGTEDDEDAKFVQLEDCKHILEISGLSQWMKADTEGDNQIQMKACPRCKTVIRRNLRFSNTVKDCLKKIEKVKIITYGNVDTNKEMQNKLLKLVEKNYLSFERIKRCSLIYTSWVKSLSSSKSKSIQQITTMDNIFHLFLQFSDTADYLVNPERFNYIEQEALVKEGITVLSNYLNFSSTWILDFIQDDYLTASEQQLQQLTWEIHRLKMGKKLLKFVRERTIKSPNPDFENCVSHLISYAPFSETNLKEFKSSFQSLARSCGSAVINVSDIEKESILKAMALTKGHWYQCPNGHVYCITECGGAVMEGKCNECNATIGGAGHSLLRTNRVATEMDGARHSAWSDTANMGNYNLEDDLEDF